MAEADKGVNLLDKYKNIVDVNDYQVIFICFFFWVCCRLQKKAFFLLLNETSGSKTQNILAKKKQKKRESLQECALLFVDSERMSCLKVSHSGSKNIKFAKSIWKTDFLGGVYLASFFPMILARCRRKHFLWIKV